MFSFKEDKLKNAKFWSRGGLQQTVFYNLCYAKLEKLSFLGHFEAKIWLMFKKTVKQGISAYFKSKKAKQIRFEGLWSGPSRSYYLVQACFSKLANLDQIITPQNYARNFFFKKCTKTLIVSVVWQTVLRNKQTWTRQWPLKRLNLDQIKTPQHIYIYICIYMYIHTYIHTYIHMSWVLFLSQQLVMRQLSHTPAKGLSLART